MIPEIGQVALILALMTALVLGIAPLVGAQTNRPALMNLARPSAIALFLWVTA
jgi:cytochrome c-type biogenesis protein CcmF